MNLSAGSKCKSLAGAMLFIAIVGFSHSALAQPAVPAQVASAAGTGAETPKVTPPAPADVASAPKVSIKAVRIITDESKLVYAKSEPTSGLSSAPEVAASASGGLTSVPAATAVTPRTHLLVSSADLEIAVPAPDYDAAIAHKAKTRADFKLFINGVDASQAATLFAQVRTVDAVLLRYHVAGGSAAETLWKPLYRQNGLTGEAPLSLAFGWTATGPVGDVAPGALEEMRVAVAPWPRQTWAVVILGITLFITALVLATTDTFRDAAPPWLETYRQFTTEYDKANAAGKVGLLTKLNAAYAPANDLRCITLANHARSGGLIDAKDANDTTIGLLLTKAEVPQPTFSLSRLQMGAWFLFAVCTGLFLWIVYGELAPITGSLLIILGISVGTTGASIAAQASNASNTATASRGFLRDLVTGMDQVQHVHRYQAVIVNALLLVVGAYFVMTELAFPVFDPTWLVFLGVSGATFAGGKQALEQK